MYGVLENLRNDSKKPEDLITDELYEEKIQQMYLCNLKELLI